jgi:hypothetical protein
MSLFRGPGGILLFLVPGCIPLFTIITSVFATDVDIISDPFSTRVDVVNESLIPFYFAYSSIDVFQNKKLDNCKTVQYNNESHYHFSSYRILHKIRLM